MNKLDDKLWKIFSLYIRRRDSDENGYGKCVTCSHYGHYKDMDCGHFISRRHQCTKFDEQNNHLQCKGCNGLKSGMQYEYSLVIDRKYGQGTAEKLLIKSKQTCKKDRMTYEYLIKEYKEKISGS